MKKILSYITLAAAMILSLGSCVNASKEITQLDFNRVLMPTSLDASVTSLGDWVSFNWTKTKGATAFELELYSDPEMQNRVSYFTVDAEEVPFLCKLVADETYYFRVRGIDGNNVLEPSKWAVFTDDNNEPKSIKTYAIKESVNPVVVDRGSDYVELSWTFPAGDTDVDHILVKTADGKETEFPVSAQATGVKVTGLKPSTFYSLTVHYKSANRGSVVVWTRPAADQATVVADTAAFKQAVKDGASIIEVAYSETPYVMGEIAVKGEMFIYGKSNAQGAKPSVSGRFTAGADLASLRVEDLSLSGAAVPAEADGTGGMSIQTHVFTVGKAASLSFVEFVNLDIEGYQRGLYYDNNGGAVSGHILFDGLRVNSILGSGGDNIDIRNAASAAAELIIRNSTFNEGTRTFMRVDANPQIAKITIENNTFSNLCYDGSALVIGGSNVQGILAVKSTAVQSFVVKNNLFVNNKCWLVGGNNACIVPTFEKNYVYNSLSQFFTSAKLDDTGARADMGKEVVLANGGVELAEDPCYDSEGGIFNVTNAMVSKAGVGDPRWFQPYIYVPEDLTQEVTVPVHTWNFADSKTFYKKADVDMVRDGIRFYIGQGLPVLFENNSVIFTEPTGFNADGYPVSGAMSIKVNGTGSLVITTSSVEGAHSSLVVVSGEQALAAVAPTENRRQVVVPVETEEELIYLCPTGPIAVTELQWNDETLPVLQKVLETPNPKLSATTATQGEEIVVGWAEVALADSYQVSVDGGAATTVRETTFTVKTGSLQAGEHTVAVVAVPKASDLLRVSSKEGVADFKVKEKPAPTPGGTAGMIVFDEYVGQNPTSISEGSITMTATLGASEDKSKKLIVDSNTCYFGDAESQVKFTTRLKTGSKSSANNAITITIEDGAAGKLKVYARTGSNSDATRTISVTGASGEILSHTFDESKDKISGVVIPGEEAAKDVYTVLEADITAGTYDVLYPVNGINIYAFEFVPGGAPGPAPVSKSWVFASEDWQTELAKMGEAGKDITGTWNITIDGLNYSASKSRWTNKCIQVTQDGRADGNGVFTFTAPAAGIVTVSASGTGSTPSGDRNVVIKTDGASEQVSINCNVPSNGDPATATFTVAAGEQKLYVTGALRIYSVSYDPAK